MTRAAFRDLTRHFTGAILAPPLLTDLGIDTFRRTLFTIVAAFISMGLFLPRIFYRKYADLSALPTPDAYLRALPADTLAMIAFPMLVVGLASVVVSPMLFPDETDYRVLTPLPIRRLELFAAKAAALAIVAGIGILTVNAIASLAFPVFSGGRWAVHSIGARVLAHAIASMAASAWMVSAVMALQGACLLALPEAWRHRSAMALQAGVFVALLMSVPFLFRLTGPIVSAATVGATPQIFLPPVWFLGLEQWLLDGSRAGGFARAALAAAIAAASTVLIVGGAFVRLFRSAERLAGTAPSGRRRFAFAAARSKKWRLPSGPGSAVLAFAARGVTRNRLHQFIFLLILGAGLALLGAQIAARSDGGRSLASRPSEALTAVVAAPLLLALCTTLATRAAFLLPLDRGAGWIFRVTDDPATRATALNGVTTAFTLAAVLPAVAAALVLQPPMLGVSTLPSVALTALAALTLVEIVLVPWRRIPYTCTYLPGKRHLTFTVAVLLGSYSVFVATGAHLVRWSVQHPANTLFTGGLLLAAFAAMRRARLRTWGTVPLEFEDTDPQATIVLGL